MEYTLSSVRVTATTSQDEACSREHMGAGRGGLGLGRGRLCAMPLGTDSDFIGPGPSTKASM